MKKLTLILILFAFSFTSFSQINSEIVDPDKIWSSLESMPWSPNWYKHTYYHKFMGDTAINQLNYLKVWQSEDEDHLYWTHIGYIRSTDENDVFFMNLQNTEGLIYKFDVVQGDIFTIHNTCFWIGNEFEVEVLEIDSVFIEEANQYVNRIKLTDPNMPYSGEEYWVEGVGSLAGILWCGNDINPLTGAEYNSLCLWQNDSLMYSSPGFPNCYYTTVSISESSEENDVISVYPSPLTYQSYVSLNAKKIKNGIMEIRDVFGNLIKQTSIIPNRRFLLERGKFKSGIYIIVLFDGGKLISRKKLLVI